MRSRLETALGESKFEKLRESKVLLVGLGATGSHIAENLVKTGVKLTVVDKDVVEEENLYTSSIYRREHVENLRLKAEVIEEELSEFGKIEGYAREFNSNFDHDGFDVVIDATDNLKARIEIEKYADSKDIPWIMTAISRDKGYSAIFLEGGLSDLGVLDAENLKTCEETGVRREIAVTSAMKSSTLALNYLLGNEERSKLSVHPEGKEFPIEVSKQNQDVEIESSGSGCSDSRIRIKTNIQFGKLREKFKNSPLEVSKTGEKVFSVKNNGNKLVVFKDGRMLFDTSDLSEAREIMSQAGLEHFNSD